MMTTTNNAVRKALNLATGAVFKLEDAGSTVIDITIRGDRAVILVDKPPKELQSALQIQRHRGGLTERVMVAQLSGCQIEWLETAQPSARAVA